MDLISHKITDIRVVNIIEENATAIEKLVNKKIEGIYKEKKQILDMQTTGDNIILILGEKIEK